MTLRQPLSVEIAPGLTVTLLRAADEEAALRSALKTGGDPYSAILWPAAVAVARLLPAWVRPGDRVLDLGAGTGLCALTAARLGAHVLALDHDAAALAAIARAATLQGLDLQTARFDLLAREPLPPGELAILADVLYEPDLARAAAIRTTEMLRRGGRAIIGDPGRLARPVFLDTLAAAGLTARFEDHGVRMPTETTEITVGIAALEA